MRLTNSILSPSFVPPVKTGVIEETGRAPLATWLLDSLLQDVFLVQRDLKKLGNVAAEGFCKKACSGMVPKTHKSPCYIWKHTLTQLADCNPKTFPTCSEFNSTTSEGLKMDVVSLVLLNEYLLTDSVNRQAHGRRLLWGWLNVPGKQPPLKSMVLLTF